MITHHTIPVCRIVLIGDSSVGKTCILNQYSGNSYSEFEKSTIGATNQKIEQKVDGKSVELQVWDTAGQEKFRALSPIYYRNANAAIAIFDQTQPRTFENIGYWISSFTEIAGKDSTIFLVSNKCDLSTEGSVPFDRVKEYAENNHYYAFQTSAKTGVGIQEMFAQLAHIILEKGLIKKDPLPSPQPAVEEKKGCCK